MHALSFLARVFAAHAVPGFIADRDSLAFRNATLERAAVATEAALDNALPWRLFVVLLEARRVPGHDQYAVVKSPTTILFKSCISRLAAVSPCM